MATQKEILAEVGAVLSILDRYRGYPRDLETHDPEIQECRDRLRKLVTTSCKHERAYIVGGYTRQVEICPDCGHTENWGTY